MTKTKNTLKTLLLALIVMALWGSLFPMIKIGYKAFGIISSDIPTIILFAGLRFTFSGIVLAIICSSREKKFELPKKSEITPILLGALVTIILHYSFTYLALSIGEGSKTAIVKQICFLFLGCFAFLFDKSDKFSVNKIIAACLGFAGIIATAWDGQAIVFKLGDLLLLLASVCSAAGTIISKKATQKISPIKFVAYSQLIGGIFLLCAGLILGGSTTNFTPASAGIFLYICTASIIAYTLWNMLLKNGSVSKLSIIKFTEPLFAVIFSGIILGEKIFRISYLVALLLMLAALIVEHREPKAQKSH
jgi:drug/metabolite transporter (DMT)-like permease